VFSGKEALISPRLMRPGVKLTSHLRFVS